jgi:hypothetical protein
LLRPFVHVAVACAVRLLPVSLAGAGALPALYHYDAQGRLIAETSASGAPRREYIYLGDAPVAVIQ